jgi:hypothetical protein
MSRSRTADPETLRDGRWSRVLVVGRRWRWSIVGGAVVDGRTDGRWRTPMDGRAASSKWKGRERAHEAGWGQTAKRSSGGTPKALIRAP